MRIISGIARGMQLDAPRDRDAIRPTTDRVKEAIFSALGNLAGTTVVDLFSGSGALGAEALSRGATTVIAIEKDRKYTNLVKRNLENVAARIQERIDWRVIVGDATRAAHLLPANTPDIVLADAPYFPDGDCPIQTLLNAPPLSNLARRWRLGRRALPPQSTATAGQLPLAGPPREALRRHRRTLPQGPAPAMKKRKRSASQPWLRLHRVPCLVLVLGTLALYGISVTFGYAMDDKIYITGNTFTAQGFSGLPDIFTTELFTGYFGSERNRVSGGRYRPLTLATFAIESQLFGNSAALPHLQHASNVLLYALTILLIYWLFATQTSGSWWRSWPFLTAAVFALHPLHTEVVANIKSRDELLCLLLALSALALAVYGLRKSSHWWSIGSGCVLFLALLAKETPVSFVVAGPLLLYLCGRVKTRGEAIRVALPILLASIAYVALRLAILGIPESIEHQDIMNDPFLHASTAQRFATVAYTWLIYLKLLVLPYPLTHDYYPFHIPILNLGDLRALFSTALHASLIGTAIVLLRAGQKIIPGAIAFYALTFVLVSNLVFPIGAFMSERFVYIPSLGFAMIAALGSAAYSLRTPQTTASSASPLPSS